MTTQQIPLTIGLKDDTTFMSYLPDTNVQSFTKVINIARGSGCNFLYLAGDKGSGKSHLLQSACHSAIDYDSTALCLCLKDLVKGSVEAFYGLENIDLICLDDIDAIVQNSVFEQALDNLLERSQDSGSRILLSGLKSPSELGIMLNTLNDKLQQIPSIKLNVLSRENLVKALQLRARFKGLTLNASVAEYLLNNFSQETKELFCLLDKLDHASLAEQRRLTIPFVKGVLLSNASPQIENGTE